MKLVLLIKNLFLTIRILNLVIICFSLLLVRYTLVIPMLELSGTASTISESAFILMMFATVMIAAAGYIINDYFDSGIDAINKPGKNRTNIFFSGRETLTLYVTINIAGLAAACYFGFIQELRYPVLIFIGTIGLLYFYSASYKKMFITGNLVISFLSALTIALPVLLDPIALHSEPLMMFISVYAFYAFVMTMIRELIKDMEDAQGDAAYGATTLAIVAGTTMTRMICTVLALITSVTIIYIQIIQKQWENNILLFMYVTAFIQLPLWILAYRIFRAKNKRDDHINSSLSKMIMVTGLFSMFVFYLTNR